MSLSINQRIEIYKIIVGVMISIVGGLWTYTTYTQDARKNELKSIISLGDSIAGMNVTCKRDFKMLSELAGEAKDSRKGQCYKYFQDAFKKAIAAEITIKKPFLCSQKKWAEYWDTLVTQISLAASSEYNYADINNAWSAILKKKGLKN